MKINVTAEHLERLYRQLNRREFVHPDPLEFLYKYSNAADREIVGLIASSLAYGRVAQILVSVHVVLNRLGKHPSVKLEDFKKGRLEKLFQDFRHRFTGGDDLAALLNGIGRVRTEYGSLNNCFLAGLQNADDVVPGLAWLTKELNRACGRTLGHLLPSADDGSACKRLNLYLRWMVRSDDVDPGGWKGVKTSQLLVPMDVHMHRIAGQLGLLTRKQNDLKAAREVTDAFRKINPDDPVKYDFALTRLGIRSDMNFNDFLITCRKAI